MKVYNARMYIYFTLLAVCILFYWYLSSPEEAKKKIDALYRRAVYFIFYFFRNKWMAVKYRGRLEVYECDTCESLILGRPKDLYAPVYICKHCERELKNLAAGKPMKVYKKYCR